MPAKAYILLYMAQSKKLLVVGFIVAALGGIGLGALGVYAWQTKDTNKLEEEFAATKTALEQQILILQAAQEEAVEPLPVETKEADSRKLLTLENAQAEIERLGDCQVDFSEAAPNSTEAYSSNKWGFSAEFPFNSKWANEDYRIKPFEELPGSENEFTGEKIDAVILAGPFSIGEGCGWYRNLGVEVRDTRSYTEIVSAIEDANDPELITQAPKKKTIGDLEAVEYVLSGLCEIPYVEVLGEKYNYVVRSVCGQDTLSDLEDLVETIELLD